MLTVTPVSRPQRRGEAVFGGARHAARRDRRAARRCRYASLRIDGSRPRRSTSESCRSRAIPTRRSIRHPACGRRASRNDAAGLAIRPRGASTARARSGRAHRCAPARGGAGEPGGTGTRSCTARSPRRRPLRRAAPRPPSAFTANGLSHNTALPAAITAAHVLRRAGTAASARSRGRRRRERRRRAISASSRGETTSTTSQPSVAANAGATTRAPKPVPITATFTPPSPPGASRARGRWNRRRPTCVSGPMVSAISTVPMPTLPPSRKPTTSTLHSIAVRTSPEPMAAGGDRGHQSVARSGARAPRRCRGRRRRPSRRSRSRGARCAWPALCWSGIHASPRSAMNPTESVLSDGSDPEVLAQRDPRERARRGRRAPPRRRSRG